MSLMIKAWSKGINQKDLQTEDGHDKHIYCNGSRDHVLSYSTLGVHCSEKNCIVNTNHQVPSVENSVYL